MNEREYSTWMELFIATVNQLIEGDKAKEGKPRTGNIAKLML